MERLTLLASLGFQNRSIVASRRICLFMLCWLIGLTAELGIAQDVAETTNGTTNGVVKSLQDVPEPPMELRALLDRGNISFRFGGRRPSTVNGMKSTGGRNQTFDAETQFRLRYEFSCRCRWTWSQDVLTIRVTYDQLRLLADHEVWMAHEPSGDFWQSRLLKHELDHVRLSSDPKILALFDQRVMNEDQLQFTTAQISEILGQTIKASDRLSSPDVRALVNASVKHHFDQVVEMVDIRYAELDRVTVHGGKMVPVESEVASWLESSKD